MARILIAEDEEDLRDLVRRALTEAGHAVATAADGAEALEMAEREAPGFDLVLTDIRMPVMDGIALAETVAALRPDLTILLMTGFADQRERTDRLDAVVDDVLGKPVSLGQLVEKVDDALCGRPADIVPLARRMA